MSNIWPPLAALIAEAQVPQMNIYQFAKVYGGVTTNDVQSHIHAGLRSLPPHKWPWYYKELSRLQTEQQKTLDRYSEAVRKGEIRLPAKLTIEDIAGGQTGNPAVEAARRIIAKRAKRKVE